MEKNKDTFERFKETFWNVKRYVCGENHMAKDCQRHFKREAAKHEKEDERKAFYV